MPARAQWAIVGVGAAILCALAVWLHAQRHPASPTAANSAAVAASSSGLTFAGKIRAQNLVSVRPQTEGTVDEYAVNVGDEVFEGQTLARIGTGGLETDRQNAAEAVESVQNRLSRAESQAANAQSDASRADATAARADSDMRRALATYERQKMLFEAGATPRTTFEQARKDYEDKQRAQQTAAKAASATRDILQDLQQHSAEIRKELDNRTSSAEDVQSRIDAAEVRAPASGLVVTRKVDLGQKVEMGGELLQIATDVYNLEVVVEPPAAVLKRLRPGIEALVLVLDVQGAGMGGTIKAIDGNQVIVSFVSSISAIKPGMRADVRFKMD
jgi:HlyD family secretion protein